jgi:hypothetical protein
MIYFQAEIYKCREARKDEPQFTCGVRIAAPETVVPFWKSRFRLFQHPLLNGGDK